MKLSKEFYKSLSINLFLILIFVVTVALHKDVEFSKLLQFGATIASLILAIVSIIFTFINSSKIEDQLATFKDKHYNVDESTRSTRNDDDDQYDF